VGSKSITIAAAALVVAGCWSATAGVVGADPPEPGTTIDHDGNYAVGTDVMPGTYSSAGPVDHRGCYWKRLGGGRIIDNALSKKPQVVQIEPSDTAFKTDGCQPWQKTDSAIPDPGKSPAEALAELQMLNLFVDQHRGDQPPQP
jgi:hypothetical protein